ncbi:TetR/AcrR family transcriptional regulator [Nocardia asteroides]|uniref:TetR/AcrR family transcriptional regulator n=1 Tax=Nocardia asteroides TaxID=1824 RepID=UPI0037C9D501
MPTRQQSFHRQLLQTHAERGGLHGLDRETVLSSQRGRILLAALETVAERGYAATTVTDIVARANVSRRTFYEMYRGRDDCFEEAYRDGLAAVVEALDAAVAELDRGDWRARIRTTLDSYLRILAENEACARAVHVQCLAAGPKVAAQRIQMKTMFADRMRAASQYGSGSDAATDSALDRWRYEAIIGAIDDRIRDCLNARGAAELPGELEPCYQITLTLIGASD